MGVKIVPNGTVVGRLTVIGISDRRGIRGTVYFTCQCSCGEVTEVPGSNIRYGNIRSCGCLKRESAKAAAIGRRTHNLSLTPVYRVWQRMLARCRDENVAEYHRYGGRGIKVCRRWHKFENFLSDMGTRPVGPKRMVSIERNDTNGNYEPSNCHWVVTFEEQARNRRNNRVFTALGRTLCVAEWAELTGIKYATLYYRLVVYKWKPELALKK